MLMKTMKAQILERIHRLEAGTVFTAKDFLEIASRGTTDVTLSELVREGRIRRIRRGLYDSPRVRPTLGGVLSPDIDESARALARRHRWKIVPGGAWAANLLGLSTQVPAKISYLSDGPNKKVPVGRQTIHFKHARPQALAGAEGKPMLAVQALRHFGKQHVDEAMIARLGRLLSKPEKRKLLEASRFGVDWIYDVARKIAEDSR